MKSKKNIFISHSSKNKYIVEQLCACLAMFGIKDDIIFCSSMVGQGVKNGEKLNDVIGAAIKKAELIIFLISRDFIESSYCLEELGIGWFLNKYTNISCFYLVLPDINPAELNGFVNSKIDKLTFIDSKKKDEFSLFVNNVIERLRLKNPKTHTIINANNIFFGSIEQQLEELRINFDNEKNAEQNKFNEIENLKKIIDMQEKMIIKHNNGINDEKRKIKYDTLISLFCVLGKTDGLNKMQIQTISQVFWFNMLNEYIELEKYCGSKDALMQMLLANIYSYRGFSDKAYQRLLKYIELNDLNIYPYYFNNIILDESNTADEAIELLKKKLETTPLGVVYDSYEETISFFEDRKKNMKKNL